MARPIPPPSIPPNMLKLIAPLLVWLKVGVVLANAFVIALVTITIYHDYQQEQKQAEIITRNLAQALENQIKGAIKTNESILFAVLDEYQRQRASGHIDGKALNAYIEQVISRHTEIDALRITDARGTLIYGSDVKPGTTTNLADRQHFIRLRDDPEAGLAISPPQVSRVNQKWVIVLARRINLPDGSFGGMAFVAIAVEHLSKSFSSLDVGRNGVITLRDDGIRLVARYPQVPLANGAVGSTLTVPAFREMIDAGKTTATLRVPSLLDGIERTYTYRQVGHYPLYVFIGLAPRDYLAEWRKTAIMQAVVAGLFVLTTMLAAALMLRTWRLHFNLSESLAESEARLRETINSALDAVINIDSSGKLIDFNPAAEKIFGWKKEEVLGRAIEDILIPDQHRRAHHEGLSRYGQTHEAKIINQRTETTAMRRNGEIFPVELAITAIRRNKEEIFTAYLRDLTESKKLEEEIRQLAFYDPLTKLPNRRLLNDRLSQARAANKRGRYGAVIFLDLDNFKPLNDAHGHEVGDLLLVEVANRLRSCVREMDTVSRFGGDEFVVIVSELTADKAESTAQAKVVAEKIRSVLSEPYLLKVSRAGASDTRVEHRCTASIGVALFGDDKEACDDDLLKWADMAMYQAKTSGNNVFVFCGQEASSHP